MNTIGLKNAVESFEMRDAHGNTCAAALFKPGISEFELYLWDFNFSVPRCVMGNIGACKAHMDAFFYRKIAEGFEQPFADENGKAVRA